MWQESFTGQKEASSIYLYALLAYRRRLHNVVED
jgi:hypothetical protein